MRHRLIDADRLAELLAGLRVLNAELERTLRDAERLGGHRDPQTRRFLRAVARADTAKRSPRIDGVERLPLIAAVREPVHLDHATLSRDVRKVRAGIERVAELLEHDRLFDKPEARLGDVEPAELGELRPAVVLRRIPVAVERIAVSEPLARGTLQLELLVGEGEVH